MIILDEEIGENKLEKFCSWSKINELNLLCNSLKHFQGYSSEKLKKSYLKYFEQDNFKKFEECLEISIPLKT